MDELLLGISLRSSSYIVVIKLFLMFHPDDKIAIEFFNNSGFFHNRDVTEWGVFITYNKLQSVWKRYGLICMVDCTLEK